MIRQVEVDIKSEIRESELQRHGENVLYIRGELKDRRPNSSMMEVWY
jgi:hypothetical protein